MRARVAPYAAAACCLPLPGVQVADRLRHFAPMTVGEDALPDAPIHKQAVELAEAAVNPRTLCRMDPTWHPWF